MASFIPNLNQIRDGANFVASFIRKAFLAVEAKFPIKKEDIASLNGSVIDWSDSPILPSEIIPWDSAPADSRLFFLSCIDLYRDGVCQYRDDDSLFFPPGHVLHRGLFKTQTCNDDGSWVHALAASLTIPEECPVGPPTSTGLEANTWYFVYWKLDVAGDGPEYRVSKVAPVRCDGRGPEHPLYDKLRFVGSFRTLDDGIIRPFDRHANGRVFWREVLVGPRLVTYNLHDAATSGWLTTDVSDHVPPSADAAFFSIEAGEEDHMAIRTKGDVAVNGSDPTIPGSGYYVQGHGQDNEQTSWHELPVNVRDGATGTQLVGTEIERDGESDAPDNKLTVIGYSEALL